MSGIVASYLNHRGSGLIANLGTDGQKFTSTGVGLSQGFEAAASAGKVLQCLGSSDIGHQDLTSSSATATTVSVQITPTSASSKIFVQASLAITMYYSNQSSAGGGISIYRDIGGGGFSELQYTGSATSPSVISMQDMVPEVSGRMAIYWRHKLDVWDVTHNTTSQITYKVYASEAEVNDVYFCIGEGKSNRTMVAWEIDQS